MSGAVTRFALATEWRLGGDVERVWDALMDPASWPRWWPYVRSVEERVPGDANGIGAVRRYTWTSRLPYTLAFDMRTTRVDRPRLIEGVASGELEGTGRWRLDARDGESRVRYDWIVDVTKPWMRALAPLLAPAFRWNHHAVMRAGARGIARYLGVALVGERALDASDALESA